MDFTIARLSRALHRMWWLLVVITAKDARMIEMLQTQLHTCEDYVDEMGTPRLVGCSCGHIFWRKVY